MIMKKFLCFITITLFLTSCEKWPNFLIPSSEVPRWLKERISDDEKTIKSDSLSGLRFTAWIRYEYDGDYFFEFRDPLSSSGPKVFDYDGDKTMFNHETYLNFKTERCCKQFVWKGPSYFDY